MSLNPSDAFLQAVQRSGLVSASDLATVSRQTQSEGAGTGREVADRLVEQKVLTAYQAEELLAGRGADCVVAGRYNLLERLGAGGMGTVYRARDTRLDRVVALKVLPPHSLGDPDAVARFRREARALAQLSHPNIIQAFDSGEDRGRHFLVMECVDGTNLNQLLKEKGPLPPTRAADYVHQAALGLEHAHGKGLIHRDLKPSNLLLTADRQVKLLDLGLARFLQDQVGEPGLTQEGMGMGTPDYMAPEQFHDAHTADVRADVYSLGCTLYHLLTGQVPFPGSSLSEKCQAHESREPPPLEECCPEAPVGLALAVRRMMAKRPAERFQTAREVAEALAPYVAGSSASSQRIKATTAWEGSQLSISVRRPRSRSRRWVAAALGAAAAALGTAAVALALLLVVAWPKLFPGKGEAGEPESQPAVGAPASAPLDDPNVLTVAQDGSGQFRSIREALDRVRPGMTVRVLDDAVYREPLAITRPGLQAGITLEAPRGALLEATADKVPALQITGVAGVAVRGLRFRATADRVGLIVIRGPCAGLVLDRLEMLAGRPSYSGVEFRELQLEDDDRPVILENCRVVGAQYAFGLIAVLNDYKTPLPCARVIMRGNRFIDCGKGILICGAVRKVQVVGNLFWGIRRSAIQVENLMPGAGDILIANNTVLDCSAALWLWDDRVKGENVQVRNNLVLGAARPDMLYLDSGGNPTEPRGPGDSRQLHKAWQIDRNWREVERPTGRDLTSAAWIPPAPRELSDVLRNPIPVLSRDPNDPNFLRPAKDSPLATAGAGGDLPSYVGAVPPEGVEPWHWRRTWDARHKYLFTVSRDPKAGGEFRTIGEALKAARPRTTVRVLDDAEYPESLVLDTPARHEGILLEAPKRATIKIPDSVQRAVLIRGVPQVRLKGFRFVGSAKAIPYSAFVVIAGRSPGTVLESLDATISEPGFGIVLQSTSRSAGEPPVVVQRCTLSGGYNGIVVAGLDSAAEPGARCNGVCVRENQVRGARATGILLRGNLEDVLIAGNVVRNCGIAAIELIDLAPTSQRILIANNSLPDNLCGLRVFDFPPLQGIRKGQAEVRNNLCVDATTGDMICLIAQGDRAIASEEMAKSVAEHWQLGQNWRDLSGSDTVLPLASRDHRIREPQWVSRDPSHPDFLRPIADSPMAREGAGTEDPSLPAYVGAIPPKGAEPWDWEKTWKMRSEKATGPDKK